VNDVAKYVLLSKLTEAGRKTLKANPDRILEVNKELEAYGVKVLEQYAVLGPFDFMNIVEAPNNEAVFKVSVELGSRGTVEITSMPAITLSELIKTFKK
jgi:uncharacterized protein with GYD domain